MMTKPGGAAPVSLFLVNATAQRRQLHYRLAAACYVEIPPGGHVEVLGLSGDACATLLAQWSVYGVVEATGLPNGFSGVCYAINAPIAGAVGATPVSLPGLTS